MAIYPLPDDIKDALQAALEFVADQFVRTDDLLALGAAVQSVAGRGNVAPQSAAGWLGGNATASDAALAGTPTIRFATTSGSSSYGYTGGSGLSAMGVIAGQVLTVSYDIYDTVPSSSSWVQWYDSTGASLSTSSPVVSAYAVGTWTRIVYSLSVPAAAATARLVVGAATRTAGAELHIKDVVVETHPFATTGVWKPLVSIFDLPTLYEPEAFGLPVGPSKLAGWRKALRSRTSRPVTVAVVGDSISEGTGATRLAYRWVNRAQTTLREALGVPQGAEWPFIPALYATSAADRPVATTGTPTANTTTGLGWRAADLNGSDDMVTFTFTGTSAAVVVSKASGTGVMEVSVNGGTPVTYNTNSANGGGSGAYHWPVPGITSRGTYTVTVTWASGSSVLLHGLATWDGDETQGVRVVDCAHHGWGYQTTNQARINSMGVCLAAVKPDLIVSAFGTNDIATNQPEIFRTQVQAYLTRYHASCPDVPVVLLWVYKIAAHSEAQYATYRRVLAEVAASDPLAHLLVLRGDMPDVVDPVTDPANGGLYAETIHPGDEGHRRIAALVTRAILAGAE